MVICFVLLVACMWMEPTQKILYHLVTLRPLQVLQISCPNSELFLPDSLAYVRKTAGFKTKTFYLQIITAQIELTIKDITGEKKALFSNDNSLNRTHYLWGNQVNKKDKVDKFCLQIKIAQRGLTTEDRIACINIATSPPSIPLWSRLNRHFWKNSWGKAKRPLKFLSLTDKLFPLLAAAAYNMF